MMVFNRDDWRCVSCGRAGRLECDHVLPLQDGGTDDLENLRTPCRDCHITITAARNKRHHVKGQRDWERAMAKPPHRRFRSWRCWIAWPRSRFRGRPKR